MLLKNKHAKKDLIKRVQDLEKENDSLKGHLKQNEDRLSFSTIKKFLSVQQIDILVYSPTKDLFKIYNPQQELNVFTGVPNNFNAFIALFPDDDRLEITDAFNNTNSKTVFEIRSKLIAKQQETRGRRYIELAIFNDEHNNVISIVRDIADYSKKTKELIKYRERAEESDKLKTILLSNISHQIRTPLNSITGFAELLASPTGSNPDTRKDFIEIIKRQSKRILNLIDNISEISKLESGEINISRNACNLNLLLNELLLGLNQQLGEIFKSAVELELILPKENNRDVITDSGRIQQILLNIINFCQRNTSIGKIKFGYNLDEEGNRINFFVEDTSEGLSKEEQKNLFKRFLVIDSESGRYEDPGLGLTIASEIVRAMGGKIWIESEKNKGNCFFFSLPYEITEEKETEQSIDENQHNGQYSWSNKVILIVDDEDVNTIFIEAILQDTGVQTLFAKNGLQALELIKNINKIDLILMDLKMPVMNGLRATQEIRKINTQLPIIAQTALASEEDKLQCELVGCNDIITKPIEVMELLQLLNKYLSD